MITLITGLWANPLVRKIALYAGALLVILYALRLYGNRQYQKGEQTGRQVMALEIEKQKAEEWRQKEAELEAAGADLEASRVVVETEKEALLMDRRRLSQSLAAGLSAIEKERANSYEMLAGVPSSELDSALRSVSRELQGGSITP